MKALHQIQEEDPTLIVEQNAQLKQTIIYGQGQLHLDIIKYRIEKLNGLVMEFEKPRIPYRETITKKKQMKCIATKTKWRCRAICRSAHAHRTVL